MSHFLILIPLSFLLVCEVYSELLEYQNFGLVTSQEGDYNRDGGDEPDGPCVPELNARGKNLQEKLFPPATMRPEAGGYIPATMRPDLPPRPPTDQPCVPELNARGKKLLESLRENYDVDDDDHLTTTRRPIRRPIMRPPQPPPQPPSSSGCSRSSKSGLCRIMHKMFPEMSKYTGQDYRFDKSRIR